MPETVNLFGETEPYGPKPKGHREGENIGFGSKYQAKWDQGLEETGRAGLRRGGMPNTVRIIHPLGAPPLDWWIIEEVY